MFGLTGANVGKTLAIVVDGKVLSAPIISTAISDQGVIAGNFTTEEVDRLVSALQAGMPRAEK